MNKGRAVSEFLVALARQVEHLTDEELDVMLKDAGLKGVFRSQSKSPRPKSLSQMEVRCEAEALMQKLANQSSREGASALLATLAPSRRVLIEAAKMREVHIIREDTVITITAKLIENVVGSRLDSARIRGA
jgi:hypothetical protein